MLRCASSFVIAAYAKVRRIPQDSRALPADFLRSRPIFTTFETFHEVVKVHTIMKREPEIKECMTGGKPKKNAIIFSSPADCVINGAAG
jgi:hypothetical protein